MADFMDKFADSANLSIKSAML